jgi:hypothetical protein
MSHYTSENNTFCRRCGRPRFYIGGAEGRAIMCNCDGSEDNAHVAVKRIQQLEKEVLEEINNRDYWEEKATELADLVGDFGEHTSSNCPVQNAINFLKDQEK